MAIPTPEPRIARFERMGYGMFIHWGLYAHLGQGEWVQHLRKVPMDEYARIKDTFTAEEFDGRRHALYHPDQPPPRRLLALRHQRSLRPRCATLGHPEIDSVTFEQGRPAPMSRADKDKYVAAEMCQTMNRHWGIGAEDFNCMSPAEIIGHLCTCRKVGANYLFNVGPTASGRIPDYESAPHCAASASGSPPIQRPSTTQGPPPSRAPARTSRWRPTTASICSSTTCRGAGMRMCRLAGAAPDHEALQTSSEKFRWLDNDEALRFAQEEDLLCVEATGYPYGVDRVVRIAEIR